MSGQRPRHELQRQHGGRISPVEVVEHNDERTLPGERCEQSLKRVEQPEARLLGFQFGVLRENAERRRELGHQAGDPGGGRAERAAQHRDVLATRGVRSTCIHGQ
jgi:hypothetical protein